MELRVDSTAVQARGLSDDVPAASCSLFSTLSRRSNTVGGVDSDCGLEEEEEPVSGQFSRRASSGQEEEEGEEAAIIRGAPCRGDAEKPCARPRMSIVQIPGALPWSSATSHREHAAGDHLPWSLLPPCRGLFDAREREGAHPA